MQNSAGLSRSVSRLLTVASSCPAGEALCADQVRGVVGGWRGAAGRVRAGPGVHTAPYQRLGTGEGTRRSHGTTVQSTCAHMQPCHHLLLPQVSCSVDLHCRSALNRPLWPLGCHHPIIHLDVVFS